MEFRDRSIQLAGLLVDPRGGRKLIAKIAFGDLGGKEKVADRNSRSFRVYEEINSYLSQSLERLRTKIAVQHEDLHEAFDPERQLEGAVFIELLFFGPTQSPYP